MAHQGGDVRSRLVEQQVRIKQGLTGSKQPGPAGDPASLDDGTYRAEIERDVEMRLQHIELLSEVERALRKLEQGTYGTCDVCGRAIPPERLAIRPQAALCVGCKPRPQGGV